LLWKVVSANYLEPGGNKLLEELGIRKPTWWMPKKMTRQEVMVRDVMVLGKEPAARCEHPSYLLQSALPVRNVVQDGEVEDRVNLPVWMRKISYVAHLQKTLDRDNQPIGASLWRPSWDRGPWQ
jgi:hypothetical protein